MWKTKNSINKEIWKYFLLFSILILSFLWLFQVLFFGSYYKSVKINDVKTVANQIKKNYNNLDFEESINNLALDKEVCIEIIDKNLYSLYTSSFFGKGCINNSNKTSNYELDFIRDDVKEKSYNYINSRFNSETLVYALRLKNDKYAFINTSITPIDQTSKIIRKQLILVTAVVLILSFIIAYYISRHISKPIIKMNEAAKSLAKKDFKVIFEESKIDELNELASTLNYAKDELSKTDELRRDLMANVSHDLKTPLTMIKAYAEMSIDLHKGKIKKQKEDMNTIIEETNRLTLLVNDILALSSMQSDIETLNLEEFDLITLITDILKKYKVLEELENYKFELFHEEKSLLITADKRKMEQVIYNLINNAINYTGEDLTVTIKVTKENNNVLVEIIDTGTGINEEDIPYIWDRYYKSEKRHKRNVYGTGLGLSIVKNVLELHKYQYGVKSELNKGSNFYFKIPLKKN